MSRRKNRKKGNDMRATVKEREGEYTPSPLFSVYLQTPETQSGKYFLGYKLLRNNELWRWDTLEDVKF